MQIALCAERWIIRIAAGGAAVKSLALGRGERAAAAQALGQIGIGDEQRGERDEIGGTALQRRVGAGEVVAFIGNERAAPQWTEKRGVELRRLRRTACGGGGRFRRPRLDQM